MKEAPLVEALLFDNIFFSIAKGMLKKKLNILKGDYVFKKERNMGRQSKHLYINLPVNHVKESIAFFEQLGFEFEQQFTNDQAACLVIDDTITVMLLSLRHFQSISEKQLVDAKKASEVIISMRVHSREEVDELVEQAMAAGGSPFKEKQDHEFMYGWSFQDLDGHLWEVFYMDEERSGLS